MSCTKQSAVLRVFRNCPEATLPKYQREGDACFDLHACLPHGEAAFSTARRPTVVVPTGLHFEIPAGYALMIYSRSSQGFKDDTRLANCVGVIDSGYRGEVQVKLTRDNDQTLWVDHGDRIAQAMLVRLPTVDLVEIESIDTNTERGANGFGSTGKQ